MSENRVPLKLKNNVSSLSDIFWSELNWATYGVFIATGTAQTTCKQKKPVLAREQMPYLIPNKQPRVHFYSSRSLVFFCWVLWSTHFAWNSNMAVYSSLCSLPAVKCFMFIVAKFNVRWRWLSFWSSLFPNLPGASLAPARGCVNCLNLIGQYNLQEPLLPITGLEIWQDTEDREEREERETWINPLYFVERI